MKKTICTLVMVGLLATTALAATPYPVEVNEYMTGSNLRLERVYELAPGQDVSEIPTEDFDRDGYTYSLLDMTQVPLPSLDQQGHEEVVVTTSNTKVTEEVLAGLEQTMEYSTPDGYTGELVLDPSTLVVEPAKYGTSSYTVKTSRSYPSLSSADVALLPKTVSENGRTLTLADVGWQESNGLYTASASYTAAASSQYVSEYTVTVHYAGILSKDEDAGAIVTAIFSGQPIPEPEPEVIPAPEPEPEPIIVEEDTTPWLWIAVSIIGIMALGALAFSIGNFQKKQQPKGDDET